MLSKELQDVILSQRAIGNKNYNVEAGVKVGKEFFHPVSGRVDIYIENAEEILRVKDKKGRWDAFHNNSSTFSSIHFTSNRTTFLYRMNAVQIVLKILSSQPENVTI